MGWLYTNGLQRRMGPVTLAMRQQGALQAQPPAMPPPATGALPEAPVAPPPAAPPPATSAQVVANAPMRQGYSPAVAAALMRNAPNQHLTMPTMPSAPAQPAPYQHPTPLVLPPPATGALTPAAPVETPGMIAARSAGSPEGGLPNIAPLLMGPLAFGFGKQNSSPIQDIGRAMSLGRPITDAQWAQANYGPGGK